MRRVWNDSSLEANRKAYLMQHIMASRHALKDAGLCLAATPTPPHKLRLHSLHAVYGWLSHIPGTPLQLLQLSAASPTPPWSTHNSPVKVMFCEIMVALLLLQVHCGPAAEAGLGGCASPAARLGCAHLPRPADQRAGLCPLQAQASPVGNTRCFAMHSVSSAFSRQHTLVGQWAALEAQMHGKHDRSLSLLEAKGCHPAPPNAHAYICCGGPHGSEVARSRTSHLAQCAYTCLCGHAHSVSVPVRSARLHRCQLVAPC